MPAVTADTLTLPRISTPGLEVTDRPVRSVTTAPAGFEGEGFPVRRAFAGVSLADLDPFIHMDQMGEIDYGPYEARGTDWHPHRGFETVTYMLDGHMQHQDNHGNTGDLGPGDVQWMSAASGIIHSEMPQQSEGRMRGFQLWLNLPAREKMKPAAYRDIGAKEIPVVGNVKVIAGEYRGTRGAIHGGSTDPYYFDVSLGAGETFEAALPEGHNAFLYVYEGELSVGGHKLPNRAAGILSAGALAKVEAENGARFLLLAGRPLGEPVVQYGPFVMNSREEIEQAILDFQSGRFARGEIGRIEITS